MAGELEKNAYALIVAERAKQFACGFDDAHDDTHTAGELALMGAFFAVPGELTLSYGLYFAPEHLLPGYLQDSQKLNRSTESHPDNIEMRIRDLVKAGGCIVAEIERLQRSAGVNPEILGD